MTWWQYLLLVNIYLLLFYGFYALLLSRETFFQLNRIYLVSAVFLSFFIPMIQADWVRDLFITQKVQYTLYSSAILTYQFKPIRDTRITLGEILTALYLSGMVLLAIRLAWQLFALKKIINKPNPTAAFAFFKKIKLGDRHENNPAVAEHEQVHARQWHSADVLIMELLTIINWFNPIVYLYRFAIKHIHEYIADRQAVHSGTDKSDYALILLNETFNTASHQLVTPFFNKSLLRQRILMLQKDRSRRVALFKYFLSAPLFMLMLILSSATVNKSRAIFIINSKVQQVLLLSPGSLSITPSPAAQKATQNKSAIDKVYFEKSIPHADVTLQLLPHTDSASAPDAPVFTSVEMQPQFPGGYTAFMQFLSQNIRYPQEARDENVQGRSIVNFIVEKDGSLSNIKIVRSIGAGTDEEVLRVMALSPKWIPGIQNGRRVRVSFTVPINFTLSPDNPDQNTAPARNVPALNKTPVSDSTLRWYIYHSRDTTHAIYGTPLYLVDGVEVTDLSNINPQDIQSISVYKDKLITGLYGDKAKNGVVMVVTKKKLLKLKPLTVQKN